MSMRKKPIAAGLPGDPALFKVLTEINIISHLATTEFERLLPDDLTRAQFGVINHLLRLDTLETIGELAGAFQVAQPTMSSTVNRLHAKGLVEFIPDTEDKRIKRVCVTRAGRAIRERAVKAVAPHMLAFEGAAPDTDWVGILSALTQLRAFMEGRRP
jgi:DNA-binding MarR family transcriptional regulator